MTSASVRTGNVVRLLDVRDVALDVDEVLAAVSDRTAGGIDLFVGAVRDHDHGSAVTRLEYSAHPTALERLREVADEVAAEFDVIALAAVHRLGVLEVGDLAVLTAASAAHRNEAFAASRALIDRLKLRVPIWKHQVFADGSDEWVDPTGC
ncbi:molybdopterin synthase catalytic subunit [Marmoricola sp. OAE513]|uniref:molybdenum cofactor biosynthesis protein MoaE n=1 Tax=Marmoricola sp. OAE513 TaxID=2817894 RepID=UPI001DBFE86C